MLTLTLLMLLVASFAYVIGDVLLARLDSHGCIDLDEDRFIVSAWIGVLFLANLYLSVSIFVALSPVVTIVMALVLLCLSVWLHPNRFPLVQPPISRIVVSAAALAFGVAVYCSQVVVWHDTGGYHYQVIRWLSEAGSVPGLALVHSRFGFISSWFALPGVFNHGFLEGRVGSFPGALCLLLFLLQGLLASARCLCKCWRKEDLFFATAFVLMVPVILLWGIPNSPSPDLPVIVLSVVVAWIILNVSENKENSGKHGVIDVKLLPLILAVGAASIKLSALPLVLVSGYFYLLGTQGMLLFKRIIVAGSLVVIGLVPVAMAGIVASGCAFFPVAYLCSDLPWSLGAAAAEAETTVIKEWARWGGLTPDGATSWNWIIRWLQIEKISAALLFLSLIAIIPLSLNRTLRLSKDNGCLVFLGFGGIGFMLLAAPSWRFGLGYLVVLPALAVAQFMASQPGFVRRSRGGVELGSFRLLAIIFAVILASHPHIIQRPSYKLLDIAVAEGYIREKGHPHFNLVLPPPIWNFGSELDSASGTVRIFENIIVSDQVENIDYFRPYNPEQSETCWNSPLPCSPTLLEGIKLRSKEAGYVKGFEKVNRTD